MRTLLRAPHVFAKALRPLQTPPFALFSSSVQLAHGAVRAMTVADVREWAEKTVGLLPQHAEILNTQFIDGEQLLKVTEEKLMKIGMPLGPAGKLVDAVAAISSTSPSGACARRATLIKCLP